MVLTAVWLDGATIRVDQTIHNSLSSARFFLLSYHAISLSTERSHPVMLSAAKHLAADRDRPFASRRRDTGRSPIVRSWDDQIGLNVDEGAAFLRVVDAWPDL